MIVLRSFRDDDAVGYTLPATLPIELRTFPTWSLCKLWARGLGEVACSSSPGEPQGVRWHWWLPPWRLTVSANLSHLEIATLNRAAGAWIALPPGADEPTLIERLRVVFPHLSYPIEFVPWYYVRTKADAERITFVLAPLAPLARMWALLSAAFQQGGS